jgi:hypothetical protein
MPLQLRHAIGVHEEEPVASLVDLYPTVTA